MGERTGDSSQRPIVYIAAIARCSSSSGCQARIWPWREWPDGFAKEDTTFPKRPFDVGLTRVSAISFGGMLPLWIRGRNTTAPGSCLP